MAQLAQRTEQSKSIRPSAEGMMPIARRKAVPLGLPLRVGLDLLLIGVGFWLSYLLRYQLEVGGDVGPGDYRPFTDFVPLMGLLAVLLLVVFAFRGVYRLPRWTGLLDEALLITSSALIAISALIVTVFYVQRFAFSRAIFLFSFALVVGLLVLARVVLHLTAAWMRSRGRWVDRVLVVGAGPAGERVMSALVSQPRLGFDLVGFVEDAPPADDWAIATQRMVVRPQHLGTCYELPEAVRQHSIDEVFVALPPTAHDQLHWVIEQCRAERVPFTLLPDLFELSLDKVQIHSLNGLPLITTQNVSLHGGNLVVKRAFDLLLATAGLLLGAIPMAIIALLIQLDSRGPAIFGQIRIGKHGKPFTCYKFRSMYSGAHDDYERLAGSDDYAGDPVAFKLRDDPRRTRMGRWLRQTSLDELPNLFNVLRGEMSIVGPRPHVAEEVAKYEPWQRQRLAITPGMTCLWQVNGRSDLSFDEQVRFDLYYAERWSLWLDIKIILWTLPAVLTRRGAY